MQVVTPLDLEWDRRILSRLFLRLAISVAALESAWGLAVGGRIAVLGDVTLHLGAVGWVLAALHALAGAALLHPATRRAGAAGIGALLLGWLAWLGTSGRQLEAIVPGALLFLSLRAGAPEDEGPFRPRERSLGRELAFVGSIAGTGFFARFLIGGLPFLVLVPVAGVWHHHIGRRLGSKLSRTHRVLLYVLLYWVGVGGIWNTLGHTLVRDQAADLIGWARGSPFQLELAAFHLALAVAAFLGFWIRNHLWSGTVGAKALFLYGAALVHVWSFMRTGNTNPGNTGLARSSWETCWPPRSCWSSSRCSGGREHGVHDRRHR